MQGTPAWSAFPFTRPGQSFGAPGQPFRGGDVMAMKPQRFCRHPGCRSLTTDRSGYCSVHRVLARQYDRYRGTPSQRGYGYRWRKYRDQFLVEHPACEKCWAEPSKDVDHIIPVSGPNDPLFWEPSNHQALCHCCHSQKTASENGGFGNPRKVKG